MHLRWLEGGYSLSVKKGSIYEKAPIVLYDHLHNLLHNQSLSGSEIVKKVREDLGDEWSPSPGATYNIIGSLMKKELIQETTDLDEDERDKRIKSYSLTEKGRSMVIKVTGRMRKMIGFVDQCCPNGNGGVVIIKKSDSEQG